MSEDGTYSSPSQETRFSTADLPWEPRPIDLSPHFNRDLVADAVGVATDSIDYGEGFLIVEGFDGKRTDAPEAQAEVERLAALSAAEYEGERKAAAKRLGWRATVLDGEVHALAVEGMQLSRELGAVTHRKRSLSNAAKAMIDGCGKTAELRGAGLRTALKGIVP